MPSLMRSGSPKKSLGQHFLRDENICRKIAASIAPLPGDVMLEIGPGEGALTRHLAGKVKQLLVVDLDVRMVTVIRETFPGESVTAIHGDFLSTDLVALARLHDRSIRIVGNIPYNITSPILFHILDNRQAVSDATLTMQREVARRLVAKPGTKDYGILSVSSQLFTDVHILFDVSPHAFFPKPKVQSSVVHLSVLAAPRFEILDETFTRSFVRAVFGKRRKTLRNSIRYFLEETGRSLPPGLDLRRIPEELSIRELDDLSNVVYAYQEHTF